MELFYFSNSFTSPNKIGGKIPSILDILMNTGQANKLFILPESHSQNGIEKWLFIFERFKTPKMIIRQHRARELNNMIYKLFWLKWQDLKGYSVPIMEYENDALLALKEIKFQISIVKLFEKFQLIKI